MDSVESFSPNSGEAAVSATQPTANDLAAESFSPNSGDAAVSATQPTANDLAAESFSPNSGDAAVSATLPTENDLAAESFNPYSGDAAVSAAQPTGSCDVIGTEIKFSDGVKSALEDYKLAGSCGYESDGVSDGDGDLVDEVSDAISFVVSQLNLLRSWSVRKPYHWFSKAKTIVHECVTPDYRPRDRCFLVDYGSVGATIISFFVLPSRIDGWVEFISLLESVSILFGNSDRKAYYLCSASTIAFVDYEADDHVNNVEELVDKIDFQKNEVAKKLKLLWSCNQVTVTEDEFEEAKIQLWILLDGSCTLGAAVLAEFLDSECEMTWFVRALIAILVVYKNSKVPLSTLLKMNGDEVLEIQQVKPK